MKLIWHADHLVEKDWLRYILGDLIDTEVTDLDLTCFDDNSIHVVSSNQRPLSTCITYFQECRTRCKHIVLVHVSDEWFSGGYRSYAYFDLVIRWNHSYLTNHPGIVTVPLGYPNGTGKSMRLIDQRQFTWSFIGEIKSSRIAMVAAFNGFGAQLLTGTDSLANPNPKRLSKAEYDAVLEDTVFVPCPMGNATMDTARIYESLEFGCIPLTELRVSLDYYTNLFGPNPIPAFHSWIEARRFAENALRDTSSLLRMQAEINHWWSSYKAKLCSEVRASVGGPSQAEELQRYGAKLRNRLALIHEPLRITEILRHQTFDSLSRRLARPVGPLKRIMRDSLQLGRFIKTSDQR